MRMLSGFSVVTFVVGAAAALAASAFASSKSAHRLAVSGLAEGIRFKDGVIKKVETIREEAVDIYEEARREPDESE